MNKNNIATFTLVTVAAPALILLNAGLASAGPCTQWGFAGQTQFNQSNGWTLFFESTGAKAQGRASAVGSAPGGFRMVGVNPEDIPGMHGNIDGGVDGYVLNVTARWDGGSVGRYEGSVDANGFAHGVTYDARDPSSTAKWDSNGPLQCVTPS